MPLSIIQTQKKKVNKIKTSLAFVHFSNNQKTHVGLWTIFQALDYGRPAKVKSLKNCTLFFLPWSS